jgi:hypothetical protein
MARSVVYFDGADVAEAIGRKIENEDLVAYDQQECEVEAEVVWAEATGCELCVELSNGQRFRLVVEEE